MNSTEATRIFILTVLAVIVVYDIMIDFLFGGDATISARIWDWSKRYPIVSFAAGVVCGHLFWQSNV